jgi:hypothetical protein
VGLVDGGPLLLYVGEVGEGIHQAEQLRVVGVQAPPRPVNNSLYSDSLRRSAARGRYTSTRDKHRHGLYTTAYSDSIRKTAASGRCAGTATACTQQLRVTAYVE